jgi:membrane protease YdiL (CAAX protease family)
MLTMNASIYTIVIVTVLFLIHYFTINAKWYNSFFQKRFAAEKGQIRKILFNRLLGALLFGAVPFAVGIIYFNKSVAELGLNTKLNFETIVSFLIVGTLATIVNFFAARTADNLKVYPQIRCKEWNKPLLFASAISWVIYLIGYEIMFRAFLFSICLYELGLLPAILINVVIYSVTHIPKGYKEALGAIPLGFIFCFVTYFSGSILAAILIHIVLSLSSEWFSIKYNPQIILKK